jgi:gluconate 2-dehydrogenase alpha chain
MPQSSRYLTFDQREAEIALTVFDRLFPADQRDPGASEIGVVDYVDRALAGHEHAYADWYRLGFQALDACAQIAFKAPFSSCDEEQQNALLRELEQGELAEFHTPPQILFFELLCRHLREGLFADPLYGGNRDKAGWRFLGHPGLHFSYTHEEQTANAPADKNGDIRSLADIDLAASCGPDSPSPHFDPQRGALDPAPPADVVLVGLGGVGGLIAQRLTQAGLRVVAFEAGPWRQAAQFTPDELGLGFYARAGLGPKFNQEAPVWRLRSDTATGEAVFGYGRMVNGVGGSVTHYGAWLRRFHPHHLRMRSYAEERWGRQIVPEGSTLADWPIRYEDLEPYYTELEYLIGVAGNGADNPFIPRSKPLPMPPLRSFRLGDRYSEITRALGYHPYMVPAGQNSQPYAGRPEMNYHPWGVGFGPLRRDRWDPSMDCVPDALATGNLDLRTHCRVLRILTDADGHASGVEYLSANHEQFVQQARTVIVCSYTWENVRLLFLSADAKHSSGLGNTAGQLGRHFMAKTATVIGAMFEDELWNRHTGPAAQAVLIDDMLSTEFDSAEHGFLGGGSPGMEIQALPLRISMEGRPPGIPMWGQAYKDHLRDWQHKAFIGVQQDSLPYVHNYLELDPTHRERSPLALPVIRATYAVQRNENAISDYMEQWGEDVLQRMGATTVWRAGRFSGVGSCHELGGTRMGDDPATSVVDPELQVHDTPGVYVFGGSALPSCPGINPSLTIFAVCLRAADQLIARLKHA